MKKGSVLNKCAAFFVVGRESAKESFFSSDLLKCTIFDIYTTKAKHNPGSGVVWKTVLCFHQAKYRKL